MIFKSAKKTSITNYLLDLADSKQLKQTQSKSDIPSKLLLLEKKGVDTSEFYNKLIDKSISDEDIKELNEKFKVNCPNDKSTSKPTDLHQYILWMSKGKDKKIEEKSKESEKYLTDLREKFIDFLINVVVKDYKKENTDVTPEKLIEFYFKKREDYENILDDYDLMVGQTEGIMSDDEFIDELNQENLNHKDMKRAGK